MEPHRTNRPDQRFLIQKNLEETFLSENISIYSIEKKVDLLQKFEEKIYIFKYLR